MLCAKTLKAAKAALTIILGAWATTSAHAEMSLLAGDPNHMPAVYAAETVSTKGFNVLRATNTTFTVSANSDVAVEPGVTSFARYDLSGGTGLAAFGSGITFEVAADFATARGSGTAGALVRGQPTNLVFSYTGGITARTVNDPTTPANESVRTGSAIRLLLDGADPTGAGVRADAVRAARVSVRGADSGGATYKFMLRLRLYENRSNALSATGGTFYDSGAVPIIVIDPTLKPSVKASAALTADVASNFTRFLAGAESGELAKVNVALTDAHCSSYKPGVFPAECTHTKWPIMAAGATGTGKMITVGDVLGSGSLVVKGNQSLVNLKLGAAGLTLRDATGTALKTHTEGDDKGKYIDRSLAVDAHVGLSAAGEMALTANLPAKNTATIPTSTYTASVTLRPKNADAAAIAPVTDAAAGEIKTNGTMVHLGYLTGHDGYNQRVIIANRGKVDATYVVSDIIHEDGTVATAGKMATGTVPAESQVVVKTVDMISFDSGMTRAAATINLTAPTSAISVSTTIVNLGDGSTDTSSHMVQ